MGSQLKRCNNSEIKDSWIREQKISRISHAVVDNKQRTVSRQNQVEQVLKSTNIDVTRNGSGEAERRRSTIDECVKALDHSSKCVDKSCQYQRCFRMKQVWKHFETCRRIRRIDKSEICEICKNVMSLLNYHAKRCNDESCLMPRCCEIKEGFEQWQTAQYMFLKNLIQFRMTCVPTVEKKK